MYVQHARDHVRSYVNITQKKKEEKKKRSHIIGEKNVIETMYLQGA